MSNLPEFGYWNVRAFAQLIRYILKYVGIDFTDKRYDLGEGNTFAEIENIRKNWTPDKFKLGFDLPNLPYYIDKDLKLTQSFAIMRYLGRKHGLFASEENSLVRQDLAEQQISDLRLAFIQSLHSIKREELAENKVQIIDEIIITNLNLWSNFLGKNEWLAGKLTYVDFLLYETLDWFRLFSPKTVNQFNILIEYLERFENLPKIKEYLNSDEFKSRPLLGPLAAWGYDNY